MKSQNSELFYYVMAVYCAAALMIAVFPGGTPDSAIAIAEQPAYSAAAKNEPTKFAGALLAADKTEF